MQKPGWTMTIFKFRKQVCLISIILISLTLINCNQISKGQQRKKFEYLYKMSNQASLLREYTNSIAFYKDLDFYEGRMKMLYADVNKTEPINDWGQSKLLKENFMKTIDDNLLTMNTFRQRQFPAGENIRQEYDILIMNERVDYFMKELDDAITSVGRE